MSVQDLLNYLAIQDPASAFSKSVTEDIDGTVLERLEYIANRVGAGATAPVMLSSGDAIMSKMQWVQRATFASSTWPTGNTAIFVPFEISQAVTVLKMWAYNGATASGNTDIGIYDESYTRLVSIGPTAQSGTDQLQEFNIADTAITAGRYYMALVNSGTTGTYMARTAPMGVNDWKAMGMFQQASAGTLPATATPAVMAVDRLPLFGLALRTLVS